MHQIAEWLEKLGMSEYAQRFAENRIDRRNVLVHRRVRWTVAKCRATTACPMVYHVGNTVLPPSK